MIDAFSACPSPVEKPGGPLQGSIDGSEFVTIMGVGTWESLYWSVNDAGDQVVLDQYPSSPKAHWRVVPNARGKFTVKNKQSGKFICGYTCRSTVCTLNLVSNLPTRQANCDFGVNYRPKEEVWTFMVPGDVWVSVV